METTQEHSHVAGESTEPLAPHPRHRAPGYLVAALIAYSILPAFGIGLYTNSSGDRFFSLWYLLFFMGIAFFLMHEVITPLPPKEKRAE